MVREFRGSIQLVPQTAYPAAPVAGTLFYNENSSAVSLFDGTGWVNMKTAVITEYDEMDDAALSMTLWTSETTVSANSTMAITEEADDYIKIAGYTSNPGNQVDSSGNVTTMTDYKGRNAAMGFTLYGDVYGEYVTAASYGEMQLNITDGASNTVTLLSVKKTTNTESYDAQGGCAMLQWAAGNICKLKYMYTGCSEAGHGGPSTRVFSSSESATSDCSTWANVYLQYKLEIKNSSDDNTVDYSARVRLLTE